jgi:hypothetical protein
LSRILKSTKLHDYTPPLKISSGRPTTNSELRKDEDLVLMQSKHPDRMPIVVQKKALWLTSMETFLKRCGKLSWPSTPVPLPPSHQPLSFQLKQIYGLPNIGYSCCLNAVVFILKSILRFESDETMDRFVDSTNNETLVDLLHYSKHRKQAIF